MTGEETVDKLRRWQLRIIQERHGYRFSLDPLLLVDFVGEIHAGRIIDLGTGSGVLPLLFARITGDVEIIGVEFQEEMAELARRNVELNELSSRIIIEHRDILELRGAYSASSFGLVVANPPFRQRGTGKVSPKAGRDLARHESSATLADFLAIARYLVVPGGRICFIHHPERLADLLHAAKELKLSPIRLRTVHGSPGREARMVLAEFVKGRKGGLRVLPPLFVHESGGTYSAEVSALLGEDPASRGGGG